MARVLPDRVFFKGRRWGEFTLNPGPFNVKEHVLITIFANSGAGSVYAIHIVSAIRIFYRKNLTFFVSLIVVLTTQVLGYGWAGIFRRYLVDPAAMWWPFNLVQVSLFRALHEKEERPRGAVTRNQFFLIAFVCSFAYYVFPGYLFHMLTSISWLCWVFPSSVMVQQVGSGLHGLGIGAVGLDWSTVSAYLGSPLASPWFASANVAAGFVLLTFPIFSDGLFTSSGKPYNISSIIDANFQLDIEEYRKNGPLRLSTFFAMSYGVGFASLSSTVVHVVLFHGSEIWERSKSAFRDREMDIHTRLMRRYKQVPEWCPAGLLRAIFFTLPIGILAATTNQTPGLNIITEYIMGYLYPGRPVANMCFKVYGFISMKQALKFLQDFKLGHYMKIPPRAMFMAQVVGTLVSVAAHLGTAWWLMETVPSICDRTELPPDSPWTCPGDHVFYDASVVWGLVGPRRIFGDLGPYSAINWFFLIAFPERRWIRLIISPVVIGGMVDMPPATAVNYTTWVLVGFLFGFVIYRRRREWWRRHNYLLSGALDAGLAFMAVLLYACLEIKGTKISWWGNRPDGCPLASCPTAKGMVHDHCPIS
ncbi:unnamed protein product [Spirodela intermedia]|uniref:Uncharacterized protein n=1 Tax=Spirodela intermedia TaxID=51605 RepID=A0A7I8JVI8_SPIIN|nr:unnamed protein product [Spirodela intermedia]CAA6673653.1 unnamed protein product [Spirodela intermedia]